MTYKLFIDVDIEMLYIITYTQIGRVSVNTTDLCSEWGGLQLLMQPFLESGSPPHFEHKSGGFQLLDEVDSD